MLDMEINRIFGLKIIVSPHAQMTKTEVQWRVLPLGMIPPGTSPKTHSRRRQWIVAHHAQVPDPDRVIRIGDTIYCAPDLERRIRQAMNKRIEQATIDAFMGTCRPSK